MFVDSFCRGRSSSHRLFPLDYRGLQRASRFKKYEVIELEAGKSSKDSRPESFAPVLDSIEGKESISTDGGTWRRRLPLFDAVEDASMCEITRRQKTERKTLGVFRPAEVMDLKVTPAEKGFAESQRALLNQASLLGDRTGDSTRTALEPLPVKAKFSYRCSDPTCTKHTMSFIDWELGALYRSLAEAGDDEDTIHAKIRAKFFEQYCSDRYDTRFITGSMLKHPGSFSKTALGEALRESGIEYIHIKALGNPKPNRERYWAGDVEGGAAIYREHLNTGSRPALVELAESLGEDPACLLCFERDHTECHRDVIVEELQGLHPRLQVSHL
jgi:hypothetical protein